MTIRSAIPYMRGVNYYVPAMSYAQDVGLDGFCRMDLGAPVAANATGILNALSIAANGNTGTFQTTYTNDVMGRYGRNVTIVASAAAATVVTVEGYDYLGQPMTENITLNATTPVLGNKAFRYITNIAYLATAATLSVGWGTKLGVPYRCVNAVLTSELTAGAAPTAGTLVPGALPSVTQTAITADPRGTYTPNQVPDGVKTYVFTTPVDVVDGLHGNRHFKA